MQYFYHETSAQYLSEEGVKLRLGADLLDLVASRQQEEYRLFPAIPPMYPEYDVLIEKPTTGVWVKLNSEADIPEEYLASAENQAKVRNTDTTGSFYLKLWTVAPLTGAELNFRLNAKAVELIAESDKYVLEALEHNKRLHQQFVDYRAQLRDITTWGSYPTDITVPDLPPFIFDGGTVEYDENFEDALRDPVTGELLEVAMNFVGAFEETLG